MPLRLYELARELNHPLVDFFARKVGDLRYTSGLSLLSEDAQRTLRQLFPARAQDEKSTLDRQKMKAKKPAKKKLSAKERKARDVAAAAVTEAAAVAEAAQEAAATAAGEAADPSAPQQGSVVHQVVIGLPLPAPGETGAKPGDEPGASRPGSFRRRIKPTLEERLDSVGPVEAVVIPAALPKKVQHETRGSRLQRMQLVYGHEIPKKVRASTSEREKIEADNVVELPINIRDLSERLGIKAPDVIKYLMSQGTFLTITAILDRPMAESIANYFGKEVTFEEAKSKAEEFLDAKTSGKAESAGLRPRPPVVAVMGHVDHGKTTLLDSIRKSDVARHEAGGITQHIGGYQVERGGKRITFLDTPGHAAFTGMRARGAQITDLVVLVVAADDGVMPQTEEAVNHAKAANVPILVAVNKMDLPGSKMDKIKEQLGKLGLVPEEWSGSTVYAPVSALKGEGVDHLLEMILLQAEVMELKADHDSPAEGVVVEARQDAGRGVVASVLVRSGILRKGAPMLCGLGHGFLRQMLDEDGREVEEAAPARIVQVTGLSTCPTPGDVFHVVESIRRAKDIAEEHAQALKEKTLAERPALTLESLLSKTDGKLKEMALVVKGDVQGSVEALERALGEIGNEEARLKILHKGIGTVNESDVLLARSSGALIVAFNVTAEGKARKLAQEEKVEIKHFEIIYELLDEVRRRLEGLLDPDTEETVAGQIEVRQVFRITNAGIIAGCYINSGYAERGMPVRLLRDGAVVYKGRIQSLRRFKDDVKRVDQRYECGIRLDNYEDVKAGDILEPYVIQKTPRTLKSA